MSDASSPLAPQGQVLIYTDGGSQLRVRLDGNTVWLTQKLMAELYGVSVKTVNEHLVNIYAEAELAAESTIRNFRIVQREGSRDVPATSITSWPNNRLESCAGRLRTITPRDVHQQNSGTAWHASCHPRQCSCRNWKTAA